MIRVTHWEVVTKVNPGYIVKVKICNLAAFVRRADLSYSKIMSLIGKARLESKDFISFEGWTISWFYNDPTDPLFSSTNEKVIKLESRPKHNPKKTKIPGLSDRVRGRQCLC